MPSSKLLIATLIGCLGLVAAMPQDNKDQGTFLFGLPFLQLKDGGIRVSFGGYHAQAGLGGLLTGSGTGGGLHASAGTPWGAHAGAGLGGDLGGNDASAGGGLYARAGLGRGRPEAAAGLGGRLDGSGRSAAPASGGLYAGATLGDQLLGDANAGAGASAEAGASASGSASSQKPTSGRSSIQIISRGSKGAEKSMATRSSGDEIPKTIQQKETRREVLVPRLAAEAGLFGAVFADGSVEKVKVKNVEQIESVPAAPLVPLGENHVPSSDSGTTGGGPQWTYTPDIPAPFWAKDYLPTKYQPSSFIKNRDLISYVPAADVKVYRRIDRPRWYFKKRFWAGPRKQVIYYTGEEPEPKSVSSVK